MVISVNFLYSFLKIEEILGLSIEHGAREVLCPSFTIKTPMLSGVTE